LSLKVLSYSERADLAGEAATAAGELARSLGAVATAVELDQVSEGLKTEGDLLLVKADRTLEADPDAAAAALVELASSEGFRALLIGDTRFGTVVAAKVAARLRTGSLGKGRNVRVDGEKVVLQRDAYGGKFVAEVSAPMPCVAMIQAGAYKAAGSAPAEPDAVRVAAPGARVAILETRASQRGESGLKSSSIIVSAGRGFAKKEDLSIARDLASALGAALGCSRPLSSDLGWMGEEAHIGLTGAYVHPKLYVALGISGQLQHVAGIKDSKVIVAINKDPRAPIFQYADYGIVGDLYEVVPALTSLLKK
jgi:electron transfer flavoprotein alpha subunit